MTPLFDVRPDGIAVIRLHGFLIQADTVEMRYLAAILGCTMLPDLGDALALARKSDVRGLVLSVDSPGGDTGAESGAWDLARQIRTLSLRKRVVAHVEGTACDVAYWLTCGAPTIVASKTACVGGIGVDRTYTDAKGWLEKQGLKEIRFISEQSPKKVPDPTTFQGSVQLQERVDNLADVMISQISQLRRVSALRALRDFGQGDMLIASKALESGMIDRIGSFDDAIALVKRGPVVRAQIGKR